MRRLFSDFSTGTKLSMTFTVISLVFLALLLFSYQQYNDLQQRHMETLAAGIDSVENIYEVRVNTTAQRADLLEMSFAEANPELYLDDLKSRNAANEQAIQRLDALLPRDDERRKLFEQLKALRKAFVDTRDNEIVPKLLARQGQEVKHLIIGVQSERQDRIRELGISLTEASKKAVDADRQQLEQSMQQELRNILLAGLGLLALTVLSAFLLSRHIALPLSRLTETSWRLARGELVRTDLGLQRADEVGRLNGAFQQMSNYLSQLATALDKLAQGNLNVALDKASDQDVAGKAFQQMIDNLRALIGDIKQSVGILSAACEDIQQATGQVATSTQETATSISEIAATVEELKQSSKMSASHAHNVTESASRTREVADEGKTAVESAINGMNQIREQVQVVAESIMKLGEQSQTISDIVATVNDLAEQSNLLGVNASIEAVKAGEAGKGFSVVAQEIKALAEQSKQATAQVRTILSDIQRAIGRTTMLAEQASKVVDAGAKQAQTSGLAIRALNDSVLQSTDMAMQIAASSQQQLVAMEQVVTAIGNIRQASQDNVAGSKKVDQAVRDINQLSQRLQGAVSRFTQ